MSNSGRGLRRITRTCAVRSGPVALLAAGLLAAALQPAVAPVMSEATVVAAADQATPLAPAAPTGVAATVGPGRSYVSFTPADGLATSFTVTAWSGNSVVATATGTTSPILIWGLSYGSTYTFTVTANNGNGASGSSLPS